MPKDKILTFADKAREINKRYGIKSTSDLDDLSQIDMRSYTIEMDRLKEKQEAFKQANLPQNPMTNPALRNSQEGEFAFGGGIKADSSYITPSKNGEITQHGGDGTIWVDVKVKGFSGQNTPIYRTKRVQMTPEEYAKYTDLTNQYNSNLKEMRQAGYGDQSTLKVNSATDKRLKDLNERIRSTQSEYSKFLQSKGVTDFEIGSKGANETAGANYDSTAFDPSQYFGRRSDDTQVSFERASDPEAKKTVDYTDGTWEKNREYKAYKSPVGIQALSTAVGLAPYTQKTHERPITYTPAKPGYVNYEPERQMAIQQGIMQGENLGRDLVNTGATRGQVAQGIIQGRLGINRQVGNMYNKSFQDQTNTNAGIYGQNQMYNIGLQNKAIDENYKDARYAEEMNFMKKQAIAKGLSDFGSQMATNKYNEYLINSAGNSDAEGNTRWIQKSGAVNQPQPIQATSAQNTYQSQGNPMLQPWQRNLAVQGTKLRYPNMNQNNSYAMYEDGGELRKYYKGESLIGKFNFRR